MIQMMDREPPAAVRSRYLGPPADAGCTDHLGPRQGYITPFNHRTRTQNTTSISLGIHNNDPQNTHETIASHYTCQTLLHLRSLISCICRVQAILVLYDVNARHAICYTTKRDSNRRIGHLTLSSRDRDRCTPYLGALPLRMKLSFFFLLEGFSVSGLS